MLNLDEEGWGMMVMEVRGKKYEGKRNGVQGGEEGKLVISQNLVVKIAIW